MKKVLVTGASGFIGSFLVDLAIERGYEVYAGVRKTSSRKYLSNPAIHFLEMDFSRKEILKETINGSPRFDYIIHAAGIVKSCKKDEFFTVNYEYTKNFIEVLQQTDSIPEKFIFISSLAVFGPGNEKTLKPVKPSDEKHPVTMYGKSKLMAEQYIQSLKNFPYLILRPTGVYGPKEKDYYVAYRTFKLGIEPYIGTKEQHLTFLYVADLARLTFDALESDIVGKAYFVTDLEQYTAVQFNSIVKSILSRKTLAIVFPKVFIKPFVFINEKISCLFGKPATLSREKYHELICKNWLCESDEIVKDFNFKPEYNLEDGLRETLLWYMEEGLL